MGRLSGTGAITAGSSVREADGGGLVGDGGGGWDAAVSVVDGDRAWGQLMPPVVPGTAGGGGGIGGSGGGGTERWLSSTEPVGTVSRCAVTGDRPSHTL